LLLLAAAAAGGHWHALAVALLGGVALAGFYLVLVLINPAGMGMGDVKTAASIGTGIPSAPSHRPRQLTPSGSGKALTPRSC